MTSSRPYEPDQPLLLPPSLQDWLPPDHLVWFISEMVDQLDMGEIIDGYREGGQGNLPYHPAMMLKILIYAYPKAHATKRMAKLLQSKRGRQKYKQRKHIAEPPFGWVKRGLGFRQFSLRGLRKVSGEFNLVCMAMNLRRMANMTRWT